MIKDYMQEIQILSQKINNGYSGRKEKFRVVFNIEYIKREVSDYFNIKDLDKKSRKKEIVQARQVAMYFCNRLTKVSPADIGASIGMKDRTTVIHSCKKVRDLMSVDRGYKNSIEELKLIFEDAK